MSTVDCSRYQGVLSLAEVLAWKATGVDRIILKIGGGDSGRYEDSMWATNSAVVRAAAVILEGYWFNGTTDPAGDAVFARSIAGPTMRIWWDAESEGSMPHWTPGQVLAAHAAIDNPQGVYMSQSVTFEAGWVPVAAILPLWEAAYFGTTPPPVGSGFHVVLWQYTSTGHLPDYAGNLDLDIELAGLAVLTSTPITENGFDMPQNWNINGTIATVGESFAHVWTDPNNFSYQTNMAAWGPAVPKSMTGNELTTIIAECNARGAAYAAVGGPGVVVPTGATTDPAVILAAIAKSEADIVAHIPTKLAP